MEASVDFFEAKIDRVKPKVKQYLERSFITSQIDCQLWLQCGQAEVRFLGFASSTSSLA